MSVVNQKRTRSERVARLEIAPGLIQRGWDLLRQPYVLVRLGLCVLTIILLWVVTGSWSPPINYRTYYTPARDVVAKVSFRKPDPEATRDAKAVAARRVRYVYEQDPEPLVQLRARLKNQLTALVAAKDDSSTNIQNTWSEFFAKPPPDAPATTPEDRQSLFNQFREFLLATPDALDKVDTTVAKALAPFEQHGLLASLPPEQRDFGNQQEIVVYHKGQPEKSEIVKVPDVLIGEADSLRKNLGQIGSSIVEARVFDWLRTRLPSTLTHDKVATEAAKERAREGVPEKYQTFARGELLAPGATPISTASLELLTKEHAAYLEGMTLSQRIYYSLATLGMFIALMTLCGVYVVHYEHRALDNLRRFAAMLALVVLTVGLSVLASGDALRAELIPLVLFALTITIAYDQELALLLSAALALIIVISIGQGLSEFVILAATVASAILLVGRVRSRRKLVYVGVWVALVSLLTTVGVETLTQQPFASTILRDAGMNAAWSLIAVGPLMMTLLPFIESLFGVRTELSLLELGDVAHPLLQELVRRAPGTYNHSINVASIAEAAAESIGANGLLVRVGAYFHDIGKVLKPGYFVENQGHSPNRHESLMPAMSTLVIIAHIKDGADLARQHRLPEPIIDFILQHHGTTLVEYFFHRATEQNEGNPDAPDVDEAAFRYPGPKPQTKEAAVLMLADAVESAGRVLVEPTPARIESLVREIAMKRLLDGQFDSCSLTLKELATIEDSLVKSLTAVYHGRVKYPEQRTA